MKNKYSIIVEYPIRQVGENTIHTIPESWSNLKSLCEAKGWKYNTLCRKGDSFIKDGIRVYRVVNN
jgi:hypothetical protein